MATPSSDGKIKHLEFIQMAVSRMAANLFLLKGWTITLIAALLAIAAKDANILFFLIAYIPAVMFWILDGYFLSQERRFRALYDHVRMLPDHEVDFSLNTERFKNTHTWSDALLSRTLVVYYGVLLATMLIVTIAASCRPW